MRQIARIDRREIAPVRRPSSLKIPAAAPAVRFAALLVLLFGLRLFREGRVNLAHWWWHLRAAIGERWHRVRQSALNADRGDA